MTGAPVPDGVDFVVKIEDTSLNERGKVVITGFNGASNIRYQGEDVRKGDVILKRGTLVKKQHIGLLASLGEVNPQVYLAPKIDILSTGSELVEPNNDPVGSEIRNSNGVQIMSQLKSIGLEGNYLGIARDDPDYIRKMIEQCLNSCNVLLITGGVSMGDYDFVPAVLMELGFDITLHKMKVRPGKPLLFATRKNQFIFGIPGNPVSAFVQMEVVIKPFLYKLMGADNPVSVYSMVMGEDFKRKKSQLKLFVPIKIVDGKVFLIEYHGSGHLASYAEAEGIMQVDEGIESIKKQETVNVRPL
jgi:molybdopterin molybdotransferase